MNTFNLDTSAPMDLPDRPPDAHKGTFGYDLIVGGSVGMAGACVLAATGALRSGAGVVRLAVPEGTYQVVASQVSCPLVHPVPDTLAGTFHPDARAPILEWASDSDAVAVGPGMGRQDETAAFCTFLLPDLSRPTVLDADALNILSNHLSLLEDVTAPLVLTPHPGEFARLTGREIAAIQSERPAAAAAFAREHGVVVVLKGQKTVVTDGDRAWVNTTGNAGMATGGSGDVLTGILTSLLGQGLDPYEAARLGVFLHGRAGDRAADQRGKDGLIASDLVTVLPETLAAYRSDGS